MSKIPDGKYRCSCCDKLKKEDDAVVADWSPLTHAQVMICTNCETLRLALNIKYVIDLVNNEDL